ncbi:MAG: pyridoxamine 5'-phosphate oxidase family protein [Myxococcaceae bacterium]
MSHRLTSEVIADEAQLSALLGEPIALVKAKVATKLNRHTREWILRSPFLCLATASKDGACDVSPRGDPRGFVRILDDVTLLVPERPGNRLADSLRNVLSNPRVGLLFIVPGVTETLRVNGRATLTTDQSLLAPCAVEGKTPRLGLIIDVEQVYTHCSKAFIRSDFWNPAGFVTRDALPTNGEVLREVCGDASFDAEGYDRERAARYARREGFY